MVSWYTAEPSLAPTAWQASRSADESPARRFTAGRQHASWEQSWPFRALLGGRLHGMLRQQRNTSGELAALEKSV